jgi:hypothetical protein
MKILTLITTLILSVGVVGEICASDEVPSLISKDSKVLMLKADKEFVGGKVLVYSGNQNLIVVKKMRKRKLFIDFSDVMMGEYTVRLVKGDKEQEYHFLKK